MYAKILANMVATSHQMNAKAEGDYIGPDGFLYCGKCHTKKETSVTIKGEDGNDVEFRPYTPCKCRKAEIEAENERERKQKEAVTIERLRSTSGIPDLYVNANFSSFKERTDNKAILHMIRRYVEKFDQMAEKGNGLLFHGSVGTGKTYAAACIGNELIQRCKSVFMTSTYTMLKLRDPDEEEAYMNRIRRCALLIIDDTLTTGATVHALAGVLLRAKAKRVCALTLTGVEQRHPFGVPSGEEPHPALP